MSKERVTIVLAPDLWKRAKQAARRRGASASEFVAQALTRALADNNLDARLAAAECISAYSLPVGTPEELEEQMTRVPTNLPSKAKKGQ